MFLYRLQKTPGKHSSYPAWPCFIFIFCLAACADKTLQPAPLTVPAPNTATTSRVIIPAVGGQTIRLPRFTTDTQVLWSPLTQKEQRFPAANLASKGEDLPRISASWLPLAEHDDTRRYVYRLTHEHRELATRVLKRAEEHLPIIHEQLQQQNLPLELASLPLVESAFEPGAVSPAGAAGLWQLMPETARRFGLRVNSTEDERFNVHKSTAAATAYLTTLYALFKDWSLALAAYNSGEGTMQKALKRSGCSTLADLTAYSRRALADDQVLKEETLRFVPQFTAAVEVMARSKELGLSPEPLLLPARQDGTTSPANTDRKLSLSGKYAQANQTDPAPPPSVRIQQSR